MQCFYISEEQRIIPVFSKEHRSKRPVWMILTKEELNEFYSLKEMDKLEQDRKSCMNQEAFLLTQAMIKRWQNAEEIAQVEVYAQYDLGVLQRIAWEDEQYKPDFIRFLIRKEQLVILVDKEYEWLDRLIQTLVEETEVDYTLGYIFYRLLDCLIAEDKNYLEQMERRVENLEEDVLNEVVQHFIKEMSQIRKQVAIFKKHYDPLTDIIEDLIVNDNEICTKEDVRYFRILQNRMNRLNHLIDQIDEYTTHVREAYDAQIDIRLNRIMKYFTLITSLFLPLTLIVGWYGMNFTSMPEINWKYGYVYVIIISLISSVFCIYWFKKKKWF